MPFPIKVIFTVGVLLAAVGIACIDPRANNAGPNWMWRRGANDPVRNLLCNADGTLRRYAKPGIYLWFGLCLLILWFVVPTHPVEVIRP